MVSLIDTSVWINLLRRRATQEIKELSQNLILLEGASLCEPVHFELLRCAPLGQRRVVSELLETFPILATPSNLWSKAILLGQKCQERGFHSAPIDLLIAQVALYHEVSITTFDANFLRIAAVSKLKVNHHDPKAIARAKPTA